MDKTQELEKRIKTLEDFILSLQRDSTIPLNVDYAFRSRLGGLGQITSSAHGSETQAVNEAGVAIYNVAKVHDGFFDVSVDGVIKAIGYYD